MALASWLLAVVWKTKTPGTKTRLELFSLSHFLGGLSFPNLPLIFTKTKTRVKLEEVSENPK